QPHLPGRRAQDAPAGDPAAAPGHHCHGGVRCLPQRRHRLDPGRHRRGPDGLAQHHRHPDPAEAGAAGTAGLRAAEEAWRRARVRPGGAGHPQCRLLVQEGLMGNPWDRGPRPPRKGPPRREGDARPAPAGRPERGAVPAAAGWPQAREPDAAAAPAPRPARRAEVRLYGLNAVQAVFERRPQAIRKLYLLQSRVHALRPLLAWCVQNRVGYRVVEAEDLDRLAASSHHEGVVADVLRTAPLALDDWLAALAPGAPALALWLDGVGNPHNFGAILRSAAHFGAAVLLPERSTLALSGAAARVAEGGAEAVPLVR